MRGCSCRGTAGFAHVSCLAEEAKILYDEAEENNLDNKVLNERFGRWHTCSLCEQNYHGVVECALGWACWKTYVGRPETDWARKFAMTLLANGLSAVDHHEDSLHVQDAELSMRRRLGGSEEDLLVVQGNLAGTYNQLGRHEEALSIKRDVYFGCLRLNGEEHEATIIEALNYAMTLASLQRFEEARSLLRKTIPVVRRSRGENSENTLRMRGLYATAVYLDEGATLDDLREAVTTLEETERIARRVLGGAHPFTLEIGKFLRESRGALSAREDVDSISDAVGAL